MSVTWSQWSTWRRHGPEKHNSRWKWAADEQFKSPSLLFFIKTESSERRRLHTPSKPAVSRAFNSFACILHIACFLTDLHTVCKTATARVQRHRDTRQVRETRQRSGRPSRGPADPADPAEVRCWSWSLVSARADLSLICWRLELVSRHFSGCLEQLSSVSVAFSVIQTKPLLIPLWTASAASICLQHLFCARKCVNLRIKQSSCRVSFSSPGSCRQQTCWLLI